MLRPPTPQHPAANEEVTSLPDGSLPTETVQNLDLNPDLYDEEENESVFLQNGNENQDKDSDMSFENVNIVELKLFTMPFDDQFNSLKNSFLEHHFDSRVSRPQQSKLINYVDEEYLKIQRKFIKNQADSGNIYSLQELIIDLSKLIELLWYSINNKTLMFGQGDYMIKIVGDLEDFLAYYTLSDYFNFTSSPILTNENTSNIVRYFGFIQKIDLTLSFLIDGYDVEGFNRREKLSNTQIIRLLPIVSRLRILVVSKIEPIRLRVGVIAKNTSIDGKASDPVLHEDSCDILNKLDIEVGRLFEGILDRS